MILFDQSSAPTLPIMRCNRATPHKNWPHFRQIGRNFVPLAKMLPHLVFLTFANVVSGYLLCFTSSGLTILASRHESKGILMFRATTFLSIFGSLLLVISAIAPAHAVKYWNPTKGEYIEYTPGANSSSKSSIPRKEVAFETNQRPGSIIVDTSERRAYFVLGNGRAIRYGIGVGRTGFSWTGTHRITRKAEWPSWTPPAAMRKRVAGLPAFMPGGPRNPMGARALYIGSTLYRLHGTVEPWTIGQAVSSGCIRLVNADIIDLYNRAKVGAKIIVRH